ncbi:hypothetical protein JW979_07990 [bacterium]|nr:hypothetical protein [candidate division CSSED10-310 bacterium]
MRKYSEVSAIVLTMIVLLVMAPVCYMQSGVLDPGFGAGGVALPGLYAFEYSGVAVTLQTDGNILLGCHDAANTNHYIVRFNSDGTLDTGFGTGGFAFAGVYGHAQADVDVAVQADGKILLASQNRTINNHYIARFNTDGTLDTGFGVSGFAYTGIYGPVPSNVCVAVLTDGKILLSSYYNNASPPSGFYVARFNSDGTLDTGFGTAGYAYTGLPSDIDANVCVTL